MEETREELDEDVGGPLDRSAAYVDLLASELDALTASVARAVHEVAGSAGIEQASGTPVSVEPQMASEALPSGWGGEGSGGSSPSADSGDEWLAAMIRSIDRLARDPVTQTDTEGWLASGL